MCWENNKCCGNMSYRHEQQIVFSAIHHSHQNRKKCQLFFCFFCSTSLIDGGQKHTSVSFSALPPDLFSYLTLSSTLLIRVSEGSIIKAQIKDVDILYKCENIYTCMV